jgi:hypothetical protein
VNDLNLRARVIEISTQAKANRGPHSVNGFVVMQNNRIGLPNIRNGRDP